MCAQWGIHLFRILVVYLTPGYPKLSEQAQAFPKHELLGQVLRRLKLGQTFNKVKALCAESWNDKINAIIETPKGSLGLQKTDES